MHSEDIFLPQLPEGVVVEPLGQSLGLKPRKDGLAICPFDNDDFLRFELIEEHSGLSGDNDQQF